MAANRVTDGELNAVCAMINREMGMAEKPYLEVSGKLVAQIGNYHLSHAYGGVSLHRMHNESGGISDVFGCGHVTKRELAQRMRAFLCGLETARIAA